jgi:hypothetical protein
MFHIGKVKKMILPKKKDVISADTSVQAMVRMWDDNLLLLEVDSKIAEKIKDNDHVIADYRPVANDSPHRKMLIIKIIKGELGKKIFKEFREEFEKRKQKAQAASHEQSESPMPYIR